MKSFKKSMSILLVVLILTSTFNLAIPIVSATSPVISYHIAPYVANDYNDGLIASIDGNVFYYSDDFDPGDLGSKLYTLDNQNVVYEIHDNLIENIYTINEVLYPQTIIQHSVDNGLYYENGKFSQNSFDLQIFIQPKLSEKFANDDLIWFLNDTEKQRLYLTLKGINIKSPYGADFGASGFAFWKSYQDEVNESYNDKIMYDDSKSYSFTVNLRNDRVLNHSDYTMDFSVTPTFDYGNPNTTDVSIKVVNIDYYNEVANAKKESSPSGIATEEAEETIKLNGNLLTASTTWNNFFNTTQSRQLDEFAYVWVSELIMAEIMDYSQFNLKTELEKEVQKRVLSKLGIDSKIITTNSKLTGSVNLLTETKNGTEVLVNYVANLGSFQFGLFSSKPYGVTGTLNLSVYNVSDGSKMGVTETITINYSDIDTFIDNLQAVAKSTIFNIGKNAYGLSADKAANAITNGLMTKVLNSNSNCFSVFSRLTAKQKSVIQKATSMVISDELKKCNETVFKLATTPSTSAKLHKFECPVNVYVYDNDNNLCASIINNTVDPSYNDVFATVNGNAKEFYTVGDDYWFLVTGYDSGTMNYTVEELNISGENRKLTYENVPITTGCTYYSLSPEAENMSNVYFDLTDSEGNIISPSSGMDDSDVSYDSAYSLLRGICGDNVNFTLYQDGLLEIYGSGSMWETDPKWNNEDKKINSVVIDVGVTSICHGAFDGCTNLKNATIGNSVTSIGGEAFDGCSSLTGIIIPDSVTSIGYDAFYGCSSLTNATIGNSVTSIGYDAFYGCSSLTSIMIPDSLTRIGDYAFYGCSTLTGIIIPDSVTRIGDYVFDRCTNLKNATIGNSVTSIGNYAFFRCSSLTGIIIPDSVTSIGDCAFDGCSSLTGITIPDSVTSIGYGVFDGCTNLKNATIGNSVTSIGDYVFDRCTNLINATIGNSVTSIGFCAFWGCSSLTGIIIPDSVTSIGDDAFRGCSSLTSITIPDSVTSIGDNAFRGCSSLTNATIGNSVTSIGDNAFRDCSSLTNATIGNSVTSIGNDAFYGCSNLTGIIIPDSVTSIGKYAFSYCSSLKNATIGNNVTSIVDNAFYSCSSLTSITIPDSVTSIGNNAFEDCNNLTNATIGNSVTSIGNHAFEDCNNLTNATIGNSVTSIGYCAFLGCSSLTGIIIPDSVTSIGSSAFDGCSSLTGIIIPDSVTSIGNTAFWGCTNLKNVTIGNSITSIDSLGLGHISLISVIIGNSVTSIGDGAFRDCSNLTNVTIGNSVTSIGYKAFYGCSNLTGIIIPDSVTSIGKYAFSNCSSLKNATIGNSVTSIGDYAFRGCSSLTSITIPDSVTSIGDNAFRGCSSLTNATIGNSVTSIGDNAFRDCSSLTNATIGNSVTSIGYDAFYGCSSLTSITIPDSVTSIGDYAFDGCSSLTSITIPDSVTSIGNYAFGYCSSLTSIIIPDSVTSIGYGVFDGCTNLKNATIGNSVTSIGNHAFFRCSSLTGIIIPDSVTSIGNYAFYGCSSLTGIIRPDSVTSIGNYAFYGCSSLTGIIIPDSVTSIGDDAFNGCSSLTGIIIIPDSVTSIGDDAFYDCRSLTSITIPDSVTSIGNRAFTYCSNLTNATIGNSVTSIGNDAFYGCYSLNHIFYAGNELQREQISIESDNTTLINATWHYNTNQALNQIVIPPTCIEQGYTALKCPVCGVEYNETNYIEALGHQFENGSCIICGTEENFESSHPYENETDQSWTIHKEGAKRIAVTFSPETETESNYDFIYLYDRDHHQIGQYTGTELANKKIVVSGDIMIIRLTSDSMISNFGFSVSSVTAYYEDCLHASATLQNNCEATCGSNGYTGDLVCNDCESIIQWGEIIPATNQHNMTDTVSLPTCGTPGFIYHHCQNCDYGYYDNYIKPTGEHEMKTRIYEPNCGNKGYTYHYCVNCDYSYKDTYVDKIGDHQFENGICMVCGHADINSLEIATADEPITVTITNGEKKFYKFTPKQNGTLHYYSSGSNDTCGYLYDSDFNVLVFNDDYYDYNFDITYHITANTTYILGSRFYASMTGSFELNIEFEPDVVIGDLNGDKTVTVEDVTYLQQYLAEFTNAPLDLSDETTLLQADANHDGKVNVKDVTEIQRYIAELIQSL